MNIVLLKWYLFVSASLGRCFNSVGLKRREEKRNQTAEGFLLLEKQTRTFTFSSYIKVEICRNILQLLKLIYVTSRHLCQNFMFYYNCVPRF